MDKQKNIGDDVGESSKDVSSVDNCAMDDGSKSDSSEDNSSKDGSAQGGDSSTKSTRGSSANECDENLDVVEENSEDQSLQDDSTGENIDEISEEIADEVEREGAEFEADLPPLPQDIGDSDDQEQVSPIHGPPVLNFIEHETENEEIVALEDVTVFEPEVAIAVETINIPVSVEQQLVPNLLVNVAQLPDPSCTVIEADLQSQTDQSVPVDGQQQGPLVDDHIHGDSSVPVEEPVQLEPRVRPRQITLHEHPSPMLHVVTRETQTNDGTSETGSQIGQSRIFQSILQSQNLQSELLPLLFPASEPVSDGNNNSNNNSQGLLIPAADLVPSNPPAQENTEQQRHPSDAEPARFDLSHLAQFAHSSRQPVTDHEREHPESSALSRAFARLSRQPNMPLDSGGRCSPLTEEDFVPRINPAVDPLAVLVPTVVSVVVLASFFAVIRTMNWRPS